MEWSIRGCNPHFASSLSKVLTCLSLNIEQAFNLRVTSYVPSLRAYVDPDSTQSFVGQVYVDPDATQSFIGQLGPVIRTVGKNRIHAVIYDPPNHNITYAFQSRHRGKSKTLLIHTSIARSNRVVSFDKDIFLLHVEGRAWCQPLSGPRGPTIVQACEMPLVTCRNRPG